MRRVMLLGSVLAFAGGCATLRAIRALRQVEFSIDGVGNVLLAGAPLDRVRSVNDIDLRTAAQVGAAVARGAVPLSLTLHIRGENPEANAVTARLVRLTWTLALNGRETISGALDSTFAFPPGQPVVVSLPVSLDLYQFFRSSARDLLELALGLSGAASRPTEVTLVATPIIDTPLGAITYPTPITIARRTVGGPSP